MTTNDDTSLFDFSKLKECEAKDLSYNDTVDSLLDDNDLARKQLPKGSNSLMRAISDHLYSTTQNHDDIQQSLLDHLTVLLKTNSLPKKLSAFQGNPILIKDYFSNPQLSGFEKINLELVSSLFQAKVIVYSTTEDLYLTSLVINKNHAKTIELFRAKNNHYDSVYPKSYLQAATLSREIILSLVNKALGDPETNSDSCNAKLSANIDYRGSVDTNYTETSVEQPKVPRSYHKKSLSDVILKKFESPDHGTTAYNMFNVTTPPDDFFNSLKVRKDTTESNFSLKANLDFIEDNDLSPDDRKPTFPQSSYPISSSGLSSTGSSKADIDNIGTRVTNTKQTGMFFNENLNLVEVERRENNAQRGIQPRAKMYPTAAPFQPGLFNTTGFLTSVSSYSNNMQSGSSQDSLFSGIGNIPARNKGSDTGLNTGFEYEMSTEKQRLMQYGQNYNNKLPINQMFALPFLKKAESMTSLGDQRGRAQIDNFNFDFGLHSMTPDQLLMFHGHGGESGMDKKKMMMMEDGKRRYTGRLKFFDEAKNYGFVIMDEDGSDIFVHFDDLSKANIGKEMLRNSKSGRMIRLSFSCMQYFGKYNKSRKAIDIEYLG